MSKYYLVVVLAVALGFMGCESVGEDTAKGAGIGALGGAVLGGVIGHQDDGHGVEGALIGAAAGATAGGLIGHQMDKADAAAESNQVSVVKIAEMASSGVPDDVIIGEIKRSDSKYELTSEVIAYLKENKPASFSRLCKAGLSVWYCLSGTPSGPFLISVK